MCVFGGSFIMVVGREPFCRSFVVCVFVTFCVCCCLVVVSLFVGLFVCLFVGWLIDWLIHVHVRVCVHTTLRHQISTQHKLLLCLHQLGSLPHQSLNGFPQNHNHTQKQTSTRKYTNTQIHKRTIHNTQTHKLT